MSQLLETNTSFPHRGKGDTPEGCVALVLHAHLPYVRHNEQVERLEERWFYEAMTETYLPLLDMFDRLEQDRIPFRLTMTLTPTLLAMMEDPLMQLRYDRYLSRSLELAQFEVTRTQEQPEFQANAKMYVKHWTCLLQRYRDWDRAIIPQFKKHYEAGHLELMTCALTHAFLPFLKNTASAQAQIEYGALEHERHFGVRPKGIWLPECAYAPHLSKLLQQSGIRYFIVDHHALQHAEPLPVNGTFMPIATEDGIYAFPRDSVSSHQVWSSHEGYPGDPDYREYYRDIGFDLGWYDEDEWNYIKPYLLADGARIHTGMKYFRITGSTGEKQPYCEAWARNRTVDHARHFIHSRIQQLGQVKESVNGVPIILCPYDAELFGHWWYEGPLWIEAIFREYHHMQQQQGQHPLSFISPIDYVHNVPDVQQANMPMSTWGRGGYAEVWLQEKNDWIYKQLHLVEDELLSVLRRHTNDWGYPDLRERLANQAVREFMLSTASDWAFIIDADTVPTYASERTLLHLNRCRTLLQMLETGIYDLDTLVRMEDDAPCFPTLHYRVWLDALKKQQSQLETASPFSSHTSLTDYSKLAPLYSHIQRQMPSAKAIRNVNDRNKVHMSAVPKKRILMLAWEFPPLVIGGLSRAVYDLSRYLVKRDCEIHILTREVPGNPLYEMMEGIHVHRVPMPSSPTSIGFMDWVFQMNACITMCADVLFKEGIHFDFIHAHDWLVYLAAKDLKDTYQLPLIVTIHATEYGRNHGAIHTDMQQRIHEMEHALTQEAEHVIVCSQAMKSEVERLFELVPMKVSVIPNGVDCKGPLRDSLLAPAYDEERIQAFRQQTASSEDKIVFFIGRLVYEKGIQVLLSAMKLVRESVPNAKLVIAGSGPMASELKRITAELGLSEHVHFAGFVTDEERDLLFNMTDVSVFPSLYEPFGIVALEAMGRGVPVVVSDTGGLAEIIDHNQDGYKALCGHTESLAWHITDLLLHPDKAEQFAKQAYRKVLTRYDWNAISLSTRQVYEGVMAQ